MKTIKTTVEIQIDDILAELTDDILAELTDDVLFDEAYDRGLIPTVPELHDYDIHDLEEEIFERQRTVLTFSEDELHELFNMLDAAGYYHVGKFNRIADKIKIELNRNRYHRPDIDSFL